MKTIYLFALLSFLTLQHYVFGEIIAVFNQQGSATSIVTQDHINISIDYHSAPTFGNLLGGEIFDLYEFDESKIGQSVTVTSGNDSDFSTFSTYLTDGVQNYIASNTDANGVSIVSPQEESILIGNSSFSFNGIDLSGYTINSISFTLDSLDLNQPISSTYQHNWEGTYSIDGTAIPEPSSIALLFISGIFIHFSRLRIKK